jgi:hypothetical protein
MKTLNLAVGGGAGIVLKFKRTSAHVAANTRERRTTRVKRLFDQYLPLSIDFFLLYPLIFKEGLEKVVPFSHFFGLWGGEMATLKRFHGFFLNEKSLLFLF